MYLNKAPTEYNHPERFFKWPADPEPRPAWSMMSGVRERAKGREVAGRRDSRRQAAGVRGALRDMGVRGAGRGTGPGRIGAVSLSSWATEWGLGTGVVVFARENQARTGVGLTKHSIPTPRWHHRIH